MSCGSCGTQLSATAKFCSECGTPVVRPTQSAEYKQVTADRRRGLELLTQIRDMSFSSGSSGRNSQSPTRYLAREQARAGDSDAGIPVIRKAVDDMSARDQVGYYIPATGVLVEALLDRGGDGAAAEAEAAIERLAAASADGLVIRDVWLLRLHARFEGHIDWAEAMP